MRSLGDTPRRAAAHDGIDLVRVYQAEAVTRPRRMSPASHGPGLLERGHDIDATSAIEADAQGHGKPPHCPFVTRPR